MNNKFSLLTILLSLFCLLITTALQAAPVISNVQVSSIDDASAVVTWTTDVSSDSKVTCGTSTPPGTDTTDATYVTSHSVTLTGLASCTIYYFSVTSDDGTGPTTDDNGGSYYSFSTRYREYLLATDDVESGAGNWTVTTAAGSDWHISDCRAASPTHAWKAGKTITDPSDCGTIRDQYADDTDTRLVSESLNLGSTQNGYHLAWNEWYYIESGFDYGVVEISTDNGSNWSELGSEFSGNDGWLAGDLDLSDYSGAVNIGYHLVADAGNGFEGWYVDDLSVSRVVECGTVLSLESTGVTDDTCSGTGAGNDGYIDAGETITLSASVLNTGHVTATNLTGTLSTTTGGVTITDDTATFPDIPTNETKTSDSPHFSFTVAKTLTCGTVIEFSLHLHSDQGDWYPTFSKTVGHYAPTVDESFASGDPPTGWTVVHNGTGDQQWTTSNPCSVTPPSGITAPFEIIDSDCEDSGDTVTKDESLVTPVIDCSSASAVLLDFDTWLEYSPDDPATADVDVSTDGGTTWSPTHVVSWSEQVGSASQASSQHFDISSWAAGHSNVKIRFHYTEAQSAWSWWWMVDNVKVTLRQPSNCTMTVCCQAPSGLTNNTAVNNDPCPAISVLVSWNQDPADWGDTGNGTRSYDVLRDGTVIQSGIAYGTTSWNDTTVTEGHSYTYSVRYNNDCGSTAESAGASVATPTCATPPVPDGRLSGDPLRAAWNTGKTAIHVTYDNHTCTSNAYNLLYGDLSGLSNYTWTGSECDIENQSSGGSGYYDWTPPSGDLFWIIVGDNNDKESSWGEKYSGGSYTQRSTSESGECGTTTIDSTSTCP